MKYAFHSITILLALSLQAFASGGEAEPPQEKLYKCGGVGHISIVNAGGVSNKESIVKTAQTFEQLLMVDVKVSDAKWSLATSADDVKATGAKAAIFVINDKTLPISLVAMEARWGVVNANGLTDASVQKEVIRVLTVLLGGCSSQYAGSAMRAAFSAQDLEKNVGSSFTIDVMLPVLNNLEKMGFKTFQMLTREEAVDAGFMKK